MERILQESFYKKLSVEKIQISFNKKPIMMDLFLSFLTVNCIRSVDHLGSGNGWTKLENKGLGLIISGGISGAYEYLDSIQYGHRLSNSYNNYVNPFYIFYLLNEEGRKFFLEYYSDEINKIQAGIVSSIEFHNRNIKEEEEKLRLIQKEIERLKL